MLKSEDLPVGSAPEALRYDYFPAPHLAVIWRNWNLVGVDRLAKVLRTTPAKIVKAAESMGLVRDDSCLELWRERGPLTVIRRNWHLLDYPQLLELLDWTPEKLDYTLREDDFFWVKLGFLKPRAGEVTYRELTPAETGRCREIRDALAGIGDDIPAEAPFAFRERYRKTAGKRGGSSGGGLRMIYSYAAPCGDPLLEDADPFPDSLLEAYAAGGINAVWLPGLLYALTPWLGLDKGISQHCERRQAGLRRLVERAGRHGLKVFLYLNEPRALPTASDALPEAWRGAVQEANGVTALCPQAPGMTEALRDGIAALCRAVPDLGGFFTITMSENLTHCLARHASELRPVCPRCAGQTPVANIAAVLGAFRDGIAAAGTGQRLIAWSWGWSTEWDAELLAELPADIDIMCVSETDLPTESGGIRGTVCDYSISQVGPGPTARRLWDLARRHGHRAIAKMQLNASWELSAVPYIPVPQLVKEHLDNVAACGVDDFLLSWTLGGWPDGNLPLTDCSVEELLEADFSREESEIVREVTAEFSRAFRLFPFHQCDFIYMGPANSGCANLLYLEPTGYRATMVGFPYDDLASWSGGHFPPEVLEEAFREMSDIWGRALERLEELTDTPAKRELAVIAAACYCHWRSTWCQIAFVRRRDAGDFAGLVPLVEEEKALAARLYALQRRDSRIGFEAGNQYAYAGNDLLEKVLNCDDILRRLRSAKR